MPPTPRTHLTLLLQRADRQLLFIVRVEDGGDFLGGVMRRETDFNSVTGV